MAGGAIYPSTDLYALAATCINLLTGKPAEQLYDTFKYRWDWQAYAPQVSDRLAAILNKMLSPAPVDRYQSASEVLAELNFGSVVTGSSPPSTISISQISQPPSPSVPRKKLLSPVASFSLLEILASAAFTGFEGALLYISLGSWLSFSGLSMGIWGMVLGGLIFAQIRRLIEKVDLLIIAAISIALIFFLPILQGKLGIELILIFASMSAAAAIAITAIFKLIYQILSRLF
jgi:serine/threonine-protein kinase